MTTNKKNGYLLRTEHTSLVILRVKKHLLVSLFLLLWKITLKPKKELNFWFFVPKMTRQSFKLEKFMTDQVAYTFAYVRWLNVISTPGTDISNILNSFLLIIVISSVQWIQPVDSIQSHKNYDFFVHPTLSYTTTFLYF